MANLVSMSEFYNTNEDFRNYVDRYMKTRGIIFRDVALKHLMVQEYYKMLKEDNNG